MQQREVNEYIAKMKADQERYHAIQWENFEMSLSRIPRPRMKYCKRTQELIKAEHELIKLCQYDDAQKVRYMLERILPGETERFYSKFEKSLEAKRAALREAQVNDNLRLGEKLKGIKWTDVRRCELEKKICNQRIKNHFDDMAHAHILENKLKPEMSVKPSALWQKRPGYNSTSASLRGSQLQDYVHGKKGGEVVFAASLVTRHNWKGQVDTYSIVV